MVSCFVISFFFISILNLACFCLLLVVTIREGKQDNAAKGKIQIIFFDFLELENGRQTFVSC